jgi:hypothetical protein
MTGMVQRTERDLYCLLTSGFCYWRGYLEQETLEQIRSEIVDFENEVAQFAEGGGYVPLSHSWPLRTTRCLYAVSQQTQDLVMRSDILDIVRGYLGDAVLRDCLLQTVMPDHRNVSRGPNADLSYHRDTRWPIGPFRPMYLHVFLLMNDFTSENGATIVVPGSHFAREPGYYFKDSDPRGPQPGIDYRVYESDYFSSAVSLELPTGSLIFLDPMMIHSQGNNISALPRSLLNMTFRAATTTGAPPLLNARKIANESARVPVRPDLLELLEDNGDLPTTYGPLANEPLYGP